MLETVIISTILLFAFICLRRLFDGKISARLQYGVWLLIALRLLLVWIPLPGSSVSVMNLLPVVQDSFQSLKQNVVEEKAEKSRGVTDQKAVLQAEGSLLQNDALTEDAAISQNMEEKQIDSTVQSDEEQQLESSS